MKVVAFFSDPLYTFDVPLDGVDYLFKVDYSQRADRWYLSVFDVAGEPLRQGIKITSGSNLLRFLVSYANHPEGRMLVAGGESPGLFDLGTERARFSVLYLSTDEVEALGLDP